MTRRSIRRSRRGSQPVSISTGGSARNRRAIQAVNQTILDQPVETTVDRRRRLTGTAADGTVVTTVNLGTGLVQRGDKVFLRQAKRVTNLSDASTATIGDVAPLLFQLIKNLVEAQHLEA